MLAPSFLCHLMIAMDEMNGSLLIFLFCRFAKCLRSAIENDLFRLFTVFVDLSCGNEEIIPLSGHAVCGGARNTCCVTVDSNVMYMLNKSTCDTVFSF